LAQASSPKIVSASDALAVNIMIGVLMPVFSSFGKLHDRQYREVRHQEKSNQIRDLKRFLLRFYRYRIAAF